MKKEDWDRVPINVATLSEAIRITQAAERNSSMTWSDRDYGNIVRKMLTSQANYGGSFNEIVRQVQLVRSGQELPTTKTITWSNGPAKPVANSGGQWVLQGGAPATPAVAQPVPAQQWARQPAAASQPRRLTFEEAKEWVNAQPTHFRSRLTNALNTYGQYADRKGRRTVNGGKALMAFLTQCVRSPAGQAARRLGLDITYYFSAARGAGAVAASYGPSEHLNLPVVPLHIQALNVHSNEVHCVDLTSSEAASGPTHGEPEGDDSGTETESEDSSESEERHALVGSPEDIDFLVEQLPPRFTLKHVSIARKAYLSGSNVARQAADAAIANFLLPDRPIAQVVVSCSHGVDAEAVKFAVRAVSQGFTVARRAGPKRAAALMAPDGSVSKEASLHDASGWIFEEEPDDREVVPWAGSLPGCRRLLTGLQHAIRALYTVFFDLDEWPNKKDQFCRGVARCDQFSAFRLCMAAGAAGLAPVDLLKVPLYDERVLIGVIDYLVTYCDSELARSVYRLTGIDPLQCPDGDVETPDFTERYLKQAHFAVRISEANGMQCFDLARLAGETLALGTTDGRLLRHYAVSLDDPSERDAAALER